MENQNKRMRVPSRIMQKLSKMTSEEILNSFIEMGIYTKNKELKKRYRKAT